MKEQEKKQEARTLIININFTRGVVAVLVAGLLVVAFLGYLAWGQEKVSASAPQVPEAPAAPAVVSGGLRKFYRTFETFTPTMTSTACGSGYHFASLWELLDPSNLEYDGAHPDAEVGIGWDMGEGPFTGQGGLGKSGWIRTGHAADTSGVPGRANCGNWVTSDVSSHYGTTAGLSFDWGNVEELFVWDLTTSECDYRTGVWCVED
jgi:hypothetical protein